VDLLCYALAVRPKVQAMMLRLGVSGDFSLEALILVSMAIHLLSLVAWIVALFLESRGWPPNYASRLSIPFHRCG
jgi:hypothetical protein